MHTNMQTCHIVAYYTHKCFQPRKLNQYDWHVKKYYLRKMIRAIFELGS